MLFFCKKHPQSAERGERALELARLAGSQNRRRLQQFILACARWCYGEIAEADAVFDRAIPALGRSGPALLTLTAVSFRGSIHAMLSQYDEAERALDWADQRAQELGACYDRLRSLFHKGRILGNRGRISDAWDVLEGAIRLSERVGNTRWRSRLANTQAWLLCEAQDPEAALRLDTEAAQMAREFADVEGECNSHINAARDWLALGEPARALEHLQRSEQLQGRLFGFRYHPIFRELMATGLSKAISMDGAALSRGKRPKRRAWLSCKR